MRLYNELQSKSRRSKRDVEDRSFGKHVIQESLKALEVDHIDILVSNAGLQDISEYKPAVDTTYEYFEKVMTSNTWTPMSLSLECIPYMRPGGRIIMNSSGSSKNAPGDPLLVYCASKAAMDATARNLAVIFGLSKGITVNSIGTGATDTDSLKKVMAKYGEKFTKYTEESHPLQRLGTPREIADIISFVASPEASWINGEWCRPLLSHTVMLLSCVPNGAIKLTESDLKIGNQIPANGGNMLNSQG